MESKVHPFVHKSQPLEHIQSQPVYFKDLF
jgi:hypothetical protein